MLRVQVGAALGGSRLDEFLRDALGLSRQRAKKLLDAGQVRVAGRVERMAGRAVLVGTRLEVSGLPAEEAPSGLDPSHILFQDEALVVVHKPALVNMHAVEVGDEVHLCAWLRALALAQGWPMEAGGPFVASRLDRETSGVVALGLTRAAGRSLTTLYANHQAQKRYLARVHGAWEGEGEVDAPLRQASSGVMEVHPTGQAALTRYRVLSCEGDEAWVSLWPQTGRTHQLRVHMASLGHPLVGDVLYGGRRREGVRRALLHSSRLDLPHPTTGEPCTWEAPLPGDMR
jgi:23S rRNA pseudouridine1911/1915/1917 synthase